MTSIILRVLLLFCIGVACLIYSTIKGHTHDYKHPELDSWYQGLTRPHGTTYAGGTSCCSKEDCHTTEAELRNGEWWARLGSPVRGKDGQLTEDWELGDWVKVPDEIIVRGPNGNAIPNPAGEAVLCHSRGIVNNRVVPESSTLYCFVPGTQS